MDMVIHVYGYMGRYGTGMPDTQSNGAHWLGDSD